MKLVSQIIYTLSVFYIPETNKRDHRFWILGGTVPSILIQREIGRELKFLVFYPFTAFMNVNTRYSQEWGRIGTFINLARPALCVHLSALPVFFKFNIPMNTLNDWFGRAGTKLKSTNISVLPSDSLLITNTVRQIALHLLTWISITGQV